MWSQTTSEVHLFCPLWEMVFVPNFLGEAVELRLEWEIALCKKEKLFLISTQIFQEHDIPFREEMNSEYKFIWEMQG